MRTTFDETDGYGLSGRLWRNFAMPGDRSFSGSASGNQSIGFFDDFFKMSDTTLEDGYIKVQTGSGTVAQIASTGKTATTGMGICRLLTTAADNDEAIISWGNGLDAPFKLTGSDLCFEARVSLSDITTSSHGFFLGLGSLGCGVTVQCITADDAIYATGDFLGFQQLKAETTAIDGMYQVSGDTKVDGAVNTGLDTLGAFELVAGTYVKLGFRYNATYGTVHWFVNGVEDTGARLKVANIEAASADSFPDGSFMTPVACLMNDSTTAANLDIDWWACAQAI